MDISNDDDDESVNPDLESMGQTSVVYRHIMYS